MSAKKDRKNSIQAWQIPECGQSMGTIKADPNDPNSHNHHRRYRWCHLRATHRVTYPDGESERTEHACQAHLHIVLDWAAKRRTWARRYGVELSEPTIVELTFTADTHAAAYGRTRFLCSERVVTGAIAQALIATQSRIPPPPPRRRPASDRQSVPPKPTPVQETLF